MVGDDEPRSKSAGEGGILLENETQDVHKKPVSARRRRIELCRAGSVGVKRPKDPSEGGSMSSSPPDRDADDGLIGILAVGGDAMLMAMPIVVYWLYAGVYEALSCFSGLDSYRLHPRKEEQSNNLASKAEVVKGVLLQQVIQATLTLLLTKLAGDDPNRHKPETTTAAAAARFFVAMVVFDSWQYFVHRCMHHNRLLYRKFHSWHHRIVAPYAFAAQYNHPVDGVLTETVAGALAYLVSGMSPATAAAFFCFATVKGIDDHCGLLLPWNPFHLVFGNNAAYHEVHHRRRGGGSTHNYAQPFFVAWDKIMGTYLPYAVAKREDGAGYEVRVAENKKTE
ncbi:sphinganine C4-monooxygenase 1-like isoform X2 [Curcuma longa]|uniref:sphinganine C4-monooxygenase 1-like isoform X2 n=1 Tax=Curcuma longa TaxID=136217 RepID=UPI003D9E46E3